LIETTLQLEQNLLDVLREHTAGDPLRADVRWTNLSLKEMSRRLAERGSPAGQRVLRQLLKKLGFKKRKAHKTLTMGSHPDRDAQFQNIAQLKAEFLAAGHPVLSIDTKKRLSAISVEGAYRPPKNQHDWRRSQKERASGDVLSRRQALLARGRASERSRLSQFGDGHRDPVWHLRHRGE
jgi:hypothetical protein